MRRWPLALVAVAALVCLAGAARAASSRLNLTQLCDHLERHSSAGFHCYNTSRPGVSAARGFAQRHPSFRASTDLQPVILVPGLGGSGLEGRLDRAVVPAWYCVKTWDWYQIWIALYEIIAQKCFLSDLQLRYNISNNSYANQTGVHIRPLDFGGLDGVAYLDNTGDDPFKLTAVFADFIDNLVAIGYRAGVTLFGAPYDWRLPVDTYFAGGMQAQWKALVERAYAASGGKKVHFVTHSMGGPTTLYFLNSMPSSWKQQYVAAFIPLAGPWSGSAKALRAIVSGDNFGAVVGDVELVPSERVCVNARQYGGIHYLVPDPLFWPPDMVLVTTPKRSYTSSNEDIRQLFVDVGSPVSSAIFDRTRHLLDDLVHPDVPTYCMYGYGMPTEIAYTYAAFDGSIRKPVHTDTSDLGDGTVPLQSLRRCKQWQSEYFDINCKEYNLVQHGAVLKNDDIIGDVLEIVTGRPSIRGCSTPVLDAALAASRVK